MRLFIKCGDMGLNCEVSSVVCESGIQRGGVMQRVPDVTTRIFFFWRSTMTVFPAFVCQ